MSYTTSKQPQGKPRNLANFLREAMVGELVAINDYQMHLGYCPINDVKTTLEHIMEDEKRHYGMLLDLSRKCDQVQCKKASEISDHISLKCKSLNEHNSKKKISQSSLLIKLREDIKGELEAIIAYEDIVYKIDNKEAIEILTQIANDEKEHVEELTYILQKLDSDCYGPLEKKC
ncbi:ferritin-like domain-containing protein [uncultured Clostridium sp.]|jgi:rubrerythrin|uniref:ferritin-like domain-containing protein n=1 Tax=uncultured Clostridium sp. TaxID=59620 RepID=UPI00260FB31B|nr:ferritin-like domain-containing protein [uncultured Clostridium sp.]